MTLPDGTFYEGLWKDGLKNGKGKIIQPDGRCYEGLWKDGKLNGIGKMTCP